LGTGFYDIKDPTTIKNVDKDNLAGTFGEGYELNSIEMEISSDPVMFSRIEAVLPWLQARGQGYHCVKEPQH